MLLDIGLNGKFAVGLIVVERLIKMNKWLVSMLWKRRMENKLHVQSKAQVKQLKFKTILPGGCR